MEELKYNGYAMPSKTPWVTSKPLKHKKPSEMQRKMKRIYKNYDFSVDFDPVTKEIKCVATKKEDVNGIHKTY